VTQTVSNNAFPQSTRSRVTAAVSAASSDDVYYEVGTDAVPMVRVAHDTLHPITLRYATSTQRAFVAALRRLTQVRRAPTRTPCPH
jgi:hypothetical protein